MIYKWCTVESHRDMLSSQRREKNISHSQLGPLHWSSSSFGTLNQQGLNAIKLAYNPSQLDGWLY